MKIFDDFKSFIARGNVVDMAVGVVIGASFTSIVKSIVDDILMPVIGLLTSDLDYSELFFVLKSGNPIGPYQTIHSAKEAGAVTLNFGAFLSATITFFLVSFVLFLLLKGVSKVYKKEEAAKPPPKQEVLLQEIRDAIQAGNTMLKSTKDIK